MAARTLDASLQIVGSKARSAEMPPRDPAGYRQFFDLLRQLEVVFRETRADWSPDNLDEARSWLSRLDATMNVVAQVRSGRH
jgi:hypothetical protein